MTTRTMVKVVLLAGLMALPRPAGAGTAPPLAGANSDFPDQNLVMPFAAASPRSTFFSITNIGAGILNARWAFFDESGEQVDEVRRDIFGEGGTDIVDITAIRDRTIDANGQFVEGDPRSLGGRRGFVIVYGDDQTRLLGNFTIANLTTNSAFGVNAAGFGGNGGTGGIGIVPTDTGIAGTTFNPATLQDNLLVVLGLNGPVKGIPLNSLTNGGPPPDQTVFNVEVILLGNDPNNAILAQTTRAVRGSALFASLEDLFPGVALNSSASIVALATEGAGYTGSTTDPDGDTGVGIIGYYGQAVGPFGAGQSLRAGITF
jgi:hypothetical protein